MLRGGAEMIRLFVRRSGRMWTSSSRPDSTAVPGFPGAELMKRREVALVVPALPGVVPGAGAAASPAAPKGPGTTTPSDTARFKSCSQLVGKGIPQVNNAQIIDGIGHGIIDTPNEVANLGQVSGCSLNKDRVAAFVQSDAHLVLSGSLVGIALGIEIPEHGGHSGGRGFLEGKRRRPTFRGRGTVEPFDFFDNVLHARLGCGDEDCIEPRHRQQRHRGKALRGRSLLTGEWQRRSHRQ